MPLLDTDEILCEYGFGKDTCRKPATVVISIVDYPDLMAACDEHKVAMGAGGINLSPFRATKAYARVLRPDQKVWADVSRW